MTYTQTDVEKILRGSEALNRMRAEVKLFLKILPSFLFPEMRAGQKFSVVVYEDDTTSQALFVVGGVEVGLDTKHHGSEHAAWSWIPRGDASAPDMSMEQVTRIHRALPNVLTAVGEEFPKAKEKLELLRGLGE